MNQRPILERAFELARSGEVLSTSDLREKLRREGYTKVDEALFGPSLQRQLKALCTKARQSGASATDAPLARSE